jgi:hypothetical protein
LQLLFFISLLTNAEVEKQVVVLDGFHGLRLDLHLVPSGVDDTISKKFEPQVRLFGFLSDVSANVVTFDHELVLFRQVNYEIVTLKCLDLSDSFVFGQEFTELLLDDGELLHDFLFEDLLFLGVSLLELLLHHISEELHVLGRNGDDLLKNGHLIGALRKLLLPGELTVINGDYEDRSINTSNVEEWKLVGDAKV